MRLEIPDENRLFIVSAPSGCGKTSLIKKALAELKNLKLSISHTTRPPRPIEIEGLDYYFVTQSTFRKMITQGDFLEYATVFGAYYGTAKLFIENELAQGNNVVTEIDWQGARQLRANYSDTFSIFILPPSLHALRERLEQRAQDSAEIIESRMQQAVSEIKHFNEYNYVVVNDDFARASAEFINVLAGNLSKIEIKEAEKSLDKIIRTLGLTDDEINDE